jgi:hypothetical protein
MFCMALISETYSVAARLQSSDSGLTPLCGIFYKQVIAYQYFTMA